MKRIVQNVNELPDMSNWRAIVLDTEGSGLSVWHGDRICGIVIGNVDDQDGYYIPVRHPMESLSANPFADPALPDFEPPDTDALRPPPYRNIPWPCVRSWLQQYTNDPNRLWIFHHAKFDLGMLRADGVEVAGRLFDTMVASHDIKSDMWSYSLDSCTKMFLRWESHPWYEALMRYLKAKQYEYKNEYGTVTYNYSRAPIMLLGPYALEDLDGTRALALHLTSRSFAPAIPNVRGCVSRSQRELMQNDMKLAKVLFEMEWEGVKVDVRQCVEIRAQTIDELRALERDLFNLVGFEFNPGSYRDMEKALNAVREQVRFWMKPEAKNMHKYEPPLERDEIRGKQKLAMFTTNKERSTGRSCWNSAAVLKYLEIFKESNKKAFYLMKWYYEHELRTRILSTYINRYMKKADHRGRIHGSFNQHGTVTGRLSANDPNLQNVGKVKGTSDQKAFEQVIGEKDDEATNRKLRGLFIAGPGNVLVSIDYSQIEYRTAAFLAQDPLLLAQYRDDPTTDYHQATADLCGVDRDRAKTLNFGKLYGMGAPGLAMTLTAMGTPTSIPEARSLLTKIDTARPSLKHLIDGISEEAQRTGKVQNVLGRVCRVPKHKSYVALNYLDQGMCGDLMRDALVRVHTWIIERDLWDRCKMLITVHDEILFEMAEEIVASVAPQISDVMCDIPFMNIPVLCDIEVGGDWGSQIALEDWLKKRKKVLPESVA